MIKNVPVREQRIQGQPPSRIQPSLLIEEGCERVIEEVVSVEVVKSTQQNRYGKLCSKCGQIAFKIIVFENDGQERQEALCGRHYLELCAKYPELALRKGPSK